MKKETLSLFLEMAIALALTSCKDAKGNTEAAEQPKTEVEQEQTVKDNGEATKAKTLDAAETDAPEAKDKQAKEAKDKQAVEGGQQSKKKAMVYCTSSDGFLNIREWPNVSGKILGKLLTGGEGAEYLGSSGNWYYVRYKGTEGYVNGKYARLTGLEESSLRVAGANKKVYYVVVGSYPSLAEAKKAMYAQPDALDGSNVYRAKDNKGRTVFRQCAASYYKRSDAQEHAKGLNDYLEVGAWIWESDGVAPCVYQGIGLNGEPSPLGPR